MPKLSNWSSRGPAEGLLFEAGWFRVPLASGKKDLKISASGAPVQQSFPCFLTFAPTQMHSLSQAVLLRCSSAAPAVADRVSPIPGGDMPWLTIVGIVGNLKHTELMNEMTWVESPIFYRPLAQEPRPSIQIAVRVSKHTGSMEREIQKEIAAIDPSIPINDIEVLTARLAKTLAYPRFRATVLAFFALGALILSAIGLHGVLSQFVAQRIPEFGVRRALGAQTHDLLLLIACQGGAPVLAGLGAGVGMTLASSRVLASLLYGIQPADPNALANVSLLLLLVAGLAILFPASRAASVDPITALRDD